MIDTITLTKNVQELVNFPLNELLGNWVSGSRPSPRGGREITYRYEGSTWRLVVCPQVGQLDIRLNLPSTINFQRGGHAINYPLSPIRLWNRKRTAREVLECLACPADALERLSLKWAGDFLHSFGVRYVAYSYDAYSFDVPDVLHFLSNVKKRPTCQRWGGRSPTGIQWQFKKKRVQLYDKSDELIHKPRLLREPTQEHIELRRKVSQLATNHIRLEVTLQSAGGVRALAELKAGQLPTLDWISRADVGAYLLTQEAKALGILSLVELENANVPLSWACSCVRASCDPPTQGFCCTSAPVEVSSLLSLPRITGSDLSEVARTIGKLSSTVSGARAKATAATGNKVLQVAAFAVLSQTLTKEQFTRDLRVKDSAYRENARFLKQLGLSRLGDDGLAMHQRVLTYTEDLFQCHGPPVHEISPPRTVACGSLPPQVVTAPWGEGALKDEASEEDVNDADLEFLDEELVI